MMKWQEIWMLLQVEKETRGHPSLKLLHDATLNELQIMNDSLVGQPTPVIEVDKQEEVKYERRA